MDQLTGRRIWLTGASSGIGEALALELTKRGARVALTARRTGVLDALRTRINERGLGQGEVFPGDVQDLDEMKRIATKVREIFGAIDILISNAGTHIETKPVDFDSREYRAIMDLNYGGLTHCIKAALPDMIAKKSGYIVGVASLTGYRGLPSAAAYGASKAAMINFLESLRFHLKDFGIPVTIVNPGFVKTPLTDKNKFEMPFLVDAETSARIICDGLERRRKEISFPFPFNALLKLGRILPYPIYNWIVERVWSRMPKD